MPTSPVGWLFWVFSVVIVSLTVGIGSNLITPLVRHGGQSGLQRWRLRRKAYRDELEDLAELMMADAKIVMFRFVEPYLTTILTILFGFFMLMMTIAAIGLETNTRFYIFLGTAGVVSLIWGGVAFTIESIRLLDLGRVYLHTTISRLEQSVTDQEEE